ncbi:MAG: Peptide-methionine (R)-S-oxide reductase MsrB, partial [uncultured Gemmatimonadetes bacterium]
VRGDAAGLHQAGQAARGVAPRAGPRAVPRALRGRNGARLYQPAQRREARGHLRVRRVRAPSLHLADQVRQWHGVAQLLRPHPGAPGDEPRLQADLAAHRVPLRALRRAPGARVQRRAGADREAVLQQRGCAQVRAGERL